MGSKGSGELHWSAPHEVLVLVHSVGMVRVAIARLHLHCPMYRQHCAHSDGGVLGLRGRSQALRTGTIAGGVRAGTRLECRRWTSLGHTPSRLWRGACPSLGLNILSHGVMTATEGSLDVCIISHRQML